MFEPVGLDADTPEMGSTDSASGSHSGASCGLVGTLFPNSCRGRAESFARRLHRRLTTLGGESTNSSEDEPDLARASNKSTETSWLHASTGQRTTTSAPSNSATSLSSSVPSESRVLDTQPRHCLESDIYYDFDLRPDECETPEGIESPVEMANPTDLGNVHVNRHEDYERNKKCPRPPEVVQDYESGCLFSSPLPGTSPESDNSEIFYDPYLTSEGDKSRETFCDPLSTESETTSGLTNGLGKKIHKLPAHRRNYESKRVEDTSESTSSSCCPTLENLRETEVVRTGSFDSLNGKSSMETTSPSHESLWSTFDDSTVSLQAEETSGLHPGTISVSVQTTIQKSHSDSEITGSGLETRLTNGDEPTSENLSFNVINLEVPGDVVLDLPAESPRVLEEKPTNGANSQTESDESDRGMSRLLERLACSPNIEHIDNPELTVAQKRTNGRVSDEEETAEEPEVENEEEEEEDVPQRVRRCSSLKTGKTPPGTPGRKKIVRFADVLGLDLADVRTFLDEIPKIPNSAYSDLIYDEGFQKDSSPVNFWGTGPATFTTPLYAAGMPRGLPNSLRLDRTLVPLFQQPGGSAHFLDLVRERLVCLENVVVQDPVNMCLQGTVRVRNLDFHKSVHVRYTLDSWRNFSDLQAVYASNSCDGFSDKFTFVLYCHTLKVGQRLELAVRFQCKGLQYWDNNGGLNYCFQCLPATPSTNSGYPNVQSAITVTSVEPATTNHQDWAPTFY